MSMESRPAPDANASLADPVANREDSVIKSEGPIIKSGAHDDEPLKRKASSPSHNFEDDVKPKKPRLRSRSRSRSRSPYRRRDQRHDHYRYRDRDWDRDGQRERDRQRDMDRYHQPTARRGMEPPPARERERERFQEPDRRPPLSTEEKKRGQRFFRGLLSSLNREPRAAQQKHRDEIERRQKEKAEQRRAADEKRKAAESERRKKLARLEPIRKAAQIEFDQRAMRTRHSNLVAQAYSLKTKSGPPIYFQPWEMTKKQEDTIDRQVLEAEETVARETRAFERRKQQRLADLRGPSPQPTTIKREAMTEGPVDTSLAAATNSSPLAPGLDKDGDSEMVVTEDETLVY